MITSAYGILIVAESHNIGQPVEQEESNNHQSQPRTKEMEPQAVGFFIIAVLLYLIITFIGLIQQHCPFFGFMLRGVMQTSNTVFSALLPTRIWLRGIWQLLSCIRHKNIPLQNMHFMV